MRLWRKCKWEWFVGALCMVLGCSRAPQYVEPAKLLAQYDPAKPYPPATIRQPLNNTVFPPDLAPFTFTWDSATNVSEWVVVVDPGGGGERISAVTRASEWTPTRVQWEAIKKAAIGKPTKFTVLGVERGAASGIVFRSEIMFETSRDPVAAPIFYREVNLPFKEAVKDPTSIRWRFGTVDTQDAPPVVLEGLPVCGNCHSFSRDGATLGMDVDYANNKGSYVVAPVGRHMELSAKDVISWGDYDKKDGEQTYGLLSQVSPDGQAVISTVKDKSVFVPKPELEFSQLFFPIKGILVVYDRNTRIYAPLPGADDPRYVQSNPSWSPDGKYVVFARAEAYQLKGERARDGTLEEAIPAESGARLLLTEEDCAEFLRDGKEFKFELYRVPYNGGKGGQAEPLKGASGNGRSNFFPKYSPDGKWIVFCQSSNYMLLQPDSELYIIPAEGGEARRLACNTARMNSWHSWSPNGHWLVFSSKAHSPYTQLFLTHIDDQGQSTPPVVLTRFTAADRAANIPEFVNLAPGGIAKMQQRFLNDESHARAGYVAENSGDIEKGIAEYREALKINPRNVHAHQRLGFLLYHAKKDHEAGWKHTTEALRLDPKDGCAHYDAALVFMAKDQAADAIPHLREAVRLLPEGFDQRYSVGEMNCLLGDALSKQGMATEAVEALRKAIAAMPQHPRAHYLLALALAAQGTLAEALQHYEKARAIQPTVDTSPELHFLLSIHHEKAGQFEESLRCAEQALRLAGPGTDAGLLSALRERRDEALVKARR